VYSAVNHRRAGGSKRGGTRSTAAGVDAGGGETAGSAGGSCADGTSCGSAFGSTILASTTFGSGGFGMTAGFGSPAGVGSTAGFGTTAGFATAAGSDTGSTAVVASARGLSPPSGSSATRVGVTLSFRSISATTHARTIVATSLAASSREVAANTLGAASGRPSASTSRSVSPGAVCSMRTPHSTGSRARRDVAALRSTRARSTSCPEIADVSLCASSADKLGASSSNTRAVGAAIARCVASSGTHTAPSTATRRSIRTHRRYVGLRVRPGEASLCLSEHVRSPILSRGYHSCRSAVNICGRRRLLLGALCRREQSRQLVLASVFDALVAELATPPLDHIVEQRVRYRRREQGQH